MSATLVTCNETDRLRQRTEDNSEKRRGQRKLGERLKTKRDSPENRIHATREDRGGGTESVVSVVTLVELDHAADKIEE